jgi:hypothetical protein
VTNAAPRSPRAGYAEHPELIPRTLDYEGRDPTLQPFPTFSEILVAALKALQNQIRSARQRAAAGFPMPELLAEPRNPRTGRGRTRRCAGTSGGSRLGRHDREPRAVSRVHGRADHPAHSTSRRPGGRQRPVRGEIVSARDRRVAIITGGSQGIGAGLVAEYRQRD